MEDPATRPADPDATLKPPQFTLRTMLLATTALAGLLALMTAIGSFWSLAILFALVLVAGHVLGNAIGTRLRDRSAQRPVEPRPQVRRPPAERRDVPAPRLAEHTRLHWFTLVITVGGAIAGGYFGGGALAQSYPDATTAAVVTGYVSSAVLGAFAGFLAISFLGVTRLAISEAHAASDPHRRASQARAPRRPPE